MPSTLYHKTQLPAYRARLQRQRDVLTVAKGFSEQEITDLLAIYDALLAKVDQIQAQTPNEPL